MNEISSNKLFTIHELDQPVHTYVFTFKKINDLDAYLISLLADSLRLICNDTNQSHILIINTLAVSNTGLIKQFFSKNLQTFKQLKNCGLKKLIVVSNSPSVILTTRILSVICGSEKILFNSKCIQDAMKLASTQ